MQQNRLRIARTTISISLLLLAGCAKKHHVSRSATPTAPSQRRATAVPLPVGHTEVGVASWYGVPYHGRPAADGEIYDMETMVAAHRTMPFNTWVRVTNLSNNKSVNVRIIDRGPFVGGRILDLSKAAARQIDLLGPGFGKVRIEVIAAPVDNPATDFYGVQVGAFSSLENAERVRMQFSQQFGTAQIAVKQGRVPLWRVLVGKEPTAEGAQQLANRLASQGNNVFVVRLDSSDVSVNGVGVPAAVLPQQATPLR